MDARLKVFIERVAQFSTSDVQRVLDTIDSTCLDTYNYDPVTGHYCPIARLMRLDETIPNPTDLKVTEAIHQQFNPANALKGAPGTFYTTNRKHDLIEVLELVLLCKSTS